MKRVLGLFILVLLFSGFYSPLKTEAQLPGLTGPASSLVLSPRYPEPFDTIRATINDFSINTNGSTIAWFVDGVEVPAAANAREFTFTVGDLGETTEVVAITTLPSGVTIPAEASITPVRIDMLIEADTIAPVFYKGRTIPAEGSVVRVTAIPFTGESRRADSYSYLWKVQDQVIGGGSQFGKNFVTFRSEFGKNIPVNVEVYDGTGELIASESAVVPLADPELHFYEVNALRGLSERAINTNYIFIGDEIRVRAEPYYIDRALLFQNPFIEWKIDNQTIQNPSDDQQEITLRKQGDTGSFVLDFHIRNLQQLLQGVEDSIRITF